MPSSLTGVTDIEFVPAFDHRQVVGRLQSAILGANRLRAAVAYWCVGISELGASIVDRLSGDGFLCVDIHLPTDIERLCQMKLAGANVYLFNNSELRIDPVYEMGLGLQRAATVKSLPGTRTDSLTIECPWRRMIEPT